MTGPFWKTSWKDPTLTDALASCRAGILHVYWLIGVNPSHSKPAKLLSRRFLRSGVYPRAASVRSPPMSG